MRFSKTIFSFLTSFLLISASVSAGEREQAKRIYSILTGGTANKAKADKYEQTLKTKGAKALADEIIESGDGFYNTTLRNFFAPTTNEDGSMAVDFNDMTATLIGITRDADGTTTYNNGQRIKFFDVFYKDVMYQYDPRDLVPEADAFTVVYDTNKMPLSVCGSNAIDPGVEAVEANCIPRKIYYDHRNDKDHVYLPKYGVAIPEYNRVMNSHHAALQKYNLPYGDRKLFRNRGQHAFTTLQEDAIAGVFSTRAFAEAYYQGGTNRTPFQYFARNFMCLEMEQLNDTSIADFKVRRDVDRVPGGVTETYKNYCVGCHAGQDALGGAFAYYDFVNGRMIYRSHDPNDDGKIVDGVAPKINLNNLFANGKVVVNDSWMNLWNKGQNAYIGWGETQTGNGAASIGKMLSETKQVRSCMSKKVYEAVCYNSVLSSTDKEVIELYANDFDKDGNLKNLFAKMAVYCMGE